MERLKFNTGGSDEFKEINGKYISKAHLVENYPKRILLTIPQVIGCQVRALYSGDEKVISAWWDNSIDTASGVAYNQNGRKAKMIKDCPQLRTITPTRELIRGALPMTQAEYDSINAPEINLRDIEILNELNHNKMSMQSILRSPAWHPFLCENEQFSRRYLSSVSARHQNDLEKGIEVMRTYFSASGEDKLVARALRLKGKTQDLCGISLDYDGGRLIARLVPEAVNSC